MRDSRKFGRGEEPPAVEGLKHRVMEEVRFRLCGRCLRGRRRCMDSRKARHADRSWKAHRRRQAKSRAE